MADTSTDGEFFEGENVLNIGRVARGDKQPLQLNDMLPGGTWDLNVIDDDGVVLYTLAGQAPSAIGSGGIFSNTLLLDSYWDEDKIGYCFRHVVNASLYGPKGGHRYTYEYLLNTVAWGLKVLQFTQLCKSKKSA